MFRFFSFQSSDAEEGKSKKGQYEGPDGDLAAMLERDVLDSTPGVIWDDDAGLSEAKRLLEQAIGLPLCVPQYFQVIIYYFGVCYCMDLLTLSPSEVPVILFIHSCCYLTSWPGIMLLPLF